jgi:hypothetical protein
MRKRVSYLCTRDCEALASLSGLVASDDMVPLAARVAALQQRLQAIRDDILLSRDH